MSRKGKVTINLTPDEASDVLNFVLKDEATNTWWDHYGSNFAVSLRPRGKATAAVDVPADLPQKMCDTWAWIR